MPRPLLAKLQLCCSRMSVLPLRCEGPGKRAAFAAMRATCGQWKLGLISNNGEMDTDLRDHSACRTCIIFSNNNAGERKLWEQKSQHER